MILKELDVNVNEEIYYPDSKVVLGYIRNDSRRFYLYVANRVQTIRNATDPRQWRYIDTANNPADLATRCMSPDKLMESRWLSGPDFYGTHYLSLTMYPRRYHSMKMTRK